MSFSICDILESDDLPKFTLSCCLCLGFRIHSSAKEAKRS